MLLILPLVETVKSTRVSRKNTKKGGGELQNRIKSIPFPVKGNESQDINGLFYKRLGRGMEKLGEGTPMFFFYENQQGVVTMVPGPSEKRSCMYSTVQY